MLPYITRFGSTRMDMNFFNKSHHSSFQVCDTGRHSWGLGGGGLSVLHQVCQRGDVMMRAHRKHKQRRATFATYNLHAQLLRGWQALENVQKEQAVCLPWRTEVQKPGHVTGSLLEEVPFCPKSSSFFQRHSPPPSAHTQTKGSRFSKLAQPY